MTVDPYTPRRASRSHFITVRGLRLHVLEWGDASLASRDRPTVVMQHGWMDVAASFQFVVDALTADRHVMAIDWRGFGLSDASGSDTYWQPDYLGDLDGALSTLCFGHGTPDAPIDLLGHSLGGNVVMVYAGLRPERIRRLVNLEGFGLPAARPADAPKRLLQWLDELKQPAVLRDYPDLAAVADRLRKTNPRLDPVRANWLAGQWSRQRLDADGNPGAFVILGDPPHKRVNPLLYQRDEMLECWKLITAPVMWVEGDLSDVNRYWGAHYSTAEFHERLNVVRDVQRHVVSPAGHMLHHDQPEALARLLEGFLG